VVTNLLDKIAAQVATVTAIGARVYQGKKRLAESDNFEAAIRALNAESQGYFIFWLGPRTLRSLREPGSVEVHGVLVFYLPKDDTSDVNTAYDMAEEVAAVVGNINQFKAVGAGVNAITFEMVTDDIEDSIAEFQFTMTYDLGPNCSQ
jgi:hypothetical protein